MKRVPTPDPRGQHRARSVSKEWDFISRGTEFSVGKFLIEYFTPLTTGQKEGTSSESDVMDVWSTEKEAWFNKVRSSQNRRGGEEASALDEETVERSFWLSRSDDWVVNRTVKRIILLEFKRTSDTSETYYTDMWKIVERHHLPILEGLNALAEDRGWKVEVLPLVEGQRSVREKE